MCSFNSGRVETRSAEHNLILIYKAQVPNLPQKIPPNQPKTPQSASGSSLPRDPRQINCLRPFIFRIWTRTREILPQIFPQWDRIINHQELETEGLENPSCCKADQLNWKGIHKRNSLCKNKLFLFLSQILDNSQTLLDVLKKEMGDLGKAIDPQNAPVGHRQKRS